MCYMRLDAKYRMEFILTIFLNCPNSQNEIEPLSPGLTLLKRKIPLFCTELVLSANYY